MPKTMEDLLAELFGPQPFVNVSLEPDLPIPEGMAQTEWTPKENTQYLGFLPSIFLKGDKRPAKEQIEDRYAHGGGFYTNDDWAKNFKVVAGENENDLVYDAGSEDEERYKYLASTKLDSGEVVAIYESAFVRIIQKDGSFVITRMD